ncbi:hypothetical protein [Acaricomes phytoseiuli]|nr:hypothetical protein [Acaricomes phytoseiuli]
MTFIVVGICIGVILATGRVPKIRWVPLIAAGVLLAVAIFGFQNLRLVSTGEALLLLLSILISMVLYSGVLWDRQKLDPQVTYWGWAWRELIHPGYARALYRERLSASTSGDTRYPVE